MIPLRPPTYAATVACGEFREWNRLCMGGGRPGSTKESRKTDKLTLVIIANKKVNLSTNKDDIQSNFSTKSREKLIILCRKNLLSNSYSALVLGGEGIKTLWQKFALTIALAVK